MSEVLRDLPLKEILRPDVTPEMGFQSYEMLGDSKEARRNEELAFLDGSVKNPSLQYPLIDELKLDQGIQRLSDIAGMSITVKDPDFSDAVWNSAGYRAAEMFWLKQTKRLNEARNDPESERFTTRAKAYQDMNEQLYGKPDAETTAKVIGEVFAQADSKTLDETGLRILDELKHGTIVSVGNNPVKIRGLLGMQEGRLPIINDRLSVLKEVLQEEFQCVYDIVDSYWDEIVTPRHAAGNGLLHFDIYDMQKLYTQLRDYLDPNNEAAISVVIAEKNKQLAWDTPSMSVRIGAAREPIEDKSEMVGHLVHEFGKHALSAINGLRTEMPVLGTGVYTDASEGDQPDYLTFEEGIASLTNIAVNDDPSGWNEIHSSHYLSIALAYEGADFRESFEILWRARVLMAAPNGQQITEVLIQKQREQAYISMVRTRRGTPTEVAHSHPLTFNKDLAYLKGKILALEFLDKVGTDKAQIRQAIFYKINPLNPIHKRLADRYAPAI